MVVVFFAVCRQLFEGEAQVGLVLCQQRFGQGRPTRYHQSAQLIGGCTATDMRPHHVTPLDLDDVGCGKNGKYYIPLYTMPLDITQTIPADSGTLACGHTHNELSTSRGRGLTPFVGRTLVVTAQRESCS